MFLDINGHGDPRLIQDLSGIISAMRGSCRILAGALVIGLLVFRPAPASPNLSLESDTDLATAGYYRLHWEAGETSSRLVESTEPGFIGRRVIYAGPDTARLISGKSDGDYYYRLEAVEGAETGQAQVLSNVSKVTVAHHALDRALLFFGLGAVVFVATLGLVVFGNRTEESAQ